MAFDAGINFRMTDTFVTDGATETYCLKNDIYPITRGPVANFGWTGSGIGNQADRNSSIDRRLAGLQYTTGGVSAVFRLDLPTPGAYVVHLALGDYNASGWNPQCKILDSDGSTVLRTVADGSVTTNANQFMDAAGAIYNAAAWPTSEAGVTVTVSGTAIYLLLESLSGTFSVINHVRVVSADSPPAAPLFRRTLYRRAGSRGIVD